MTTTPAPASSDRERHYRLGPTAFDAVDIWLSRRSPALTAPVHPHDMGATDLYMDEAWRPLFAQMRAENPVNHVAGSRFGAFWNVTRFADVCAVEEDTGTFSSSWHDGGIGIVDRHAEFELPMFIAMNGAEHSVRRKALAPTFSPSEIQKLSDDVRRRTGDVLDALPQDQPFDWVSRVAVELSTGTLAMMFGFPWEHRALLTFWSDWASSVEGMLAPELDPIRLGALAEMADYFARLWHVRQSETSGTDMLSRMMQAEALRGISAEEFMGTLMLLIVGGNDTTRNTMSGMVDAFDKFPDQRAALEADPALIPGAVQELLRFVTPVNHMRRTALRDADLNGQQIAKGDKVVMWYISANRDEAVFADPDRLDLRRENARRHLSFGHGVHRCIGARLAEMQVRVLLEEMAARRMRVQVCGRRKRIRSNFIHGFRTLEVRQERY